MSELTTAKLRRWHARVCEAGRAHPANRVMSMLTGILTFAEEDCGVRVCAMPTDLAKRKARPEKAILTTDQVAEPIAHARQDTERRIYYAFAFRTDVRVSKQLGLLREDVDRARDVITIRRVQERDVSLTDQTKPMPASAKSRSRRPCARCCSDGACAARGSMANSAESSRGPLCRGNGPSQPRRRPAAFLKLAQALLAARVQRGGHPPGHPPLGAAFARQLPEGPEDRSGPRRQT